MTDRFRPEYRELTHPETVAVDRIKEYANDLVVLYEQAPNGINRELALAITKLEESVMWAVKGVTG